MKIFKHTRKHINSILAVIYVNTYVYTHIIFVFYFYVIHILFTGNYKLTGYTFILKFCNIYLPDTI
jgi:hypothetical protein